MGWVGAIYAVGLVGLFWGILKLIPAILLSQWAEDKAKISAIRAESHYRAIVAARSAHIESTQRHYPILQAQDYDTGD